MPKNKTPLRLINLHLTILPGRFVNKIPVKKTFPKKENSVTKPLALFPNSI
jgi:hypothetical protein